MDSRGNIVRITDDERDELRKKVATGDDPELVEIPDDELERVAAMNRHDRRKWYAEQRRELRAKARRGGSESDDEHDGDGRPL